VDTFGKSPWESHLNHKILKLFNLVAQESNRVSPAMIHTRQKKQITASTWLQLHNLELAVALPRDLGKQTGI
jgi:hypothetical protein